VHGDAKEWISKNKERFFLGISLDGTPHMHNVNRSNSFDKIDLDFFSSSWPDQPAKMTVSPLTIGELAGGVIFLHKKGFKVSCNNAYGMSWKEEDFYTYADQLKKLVNFYIENPDIEPCTLMNMPIKNIAFKEKALKWCGAGTAMTCIDRKGEKFPCHTFMPSSGKKPDIEKMFNVLQSDNLLDDKCKNCVIASCCPTCYGINFVESFDAIKRNEQYCIFSKIRAKAVSYMVSIMLTNRQRNYVYLKSKSDTDMKNMIFGIKEINNFQIISDGRWCAWIRHVCQQDRVITGLCAKNAN
jgi:hypothetical protein